MRILKNSMKFTVSAFDIALRYSPPKNPRGLRTNRVRITSYSIWRCTGTVYTTVTEDATLPSIFLNIPKFNWCSGSVTIKVFLTRLLINTVKVTSSTSKFSSAESVSLHISGPISTNQSHVLKNLNRTAMVISQYLQRMLSWKQRDVICSSMWMPPTWSCPWWLRADDRAVRLQTRRQR